MADPATRVVVVGHVDHGKSTLIGRLLLDLDLLHESKITDVIASSERRGVAPEWSYVLDSLQEERDQAITIDTTRIWFEHDGRRFVVIDAPGHRQFLANMLTGASEADAAVLVVDATVGVADQTLRHAFLLRFLGVSNVIVALNKIDLLDDAQQRYEQVRREIGVALDPIVPRAVIPISALHGDTIVRRSERATWYDGPTLIEALGAAHRDDERQDDALRLPVQDVYRDGNRRIIVGSVASGSLRVGHSYTLFPANVALTIAELRRWPEGAVESASAGETVGVVFDNERFAVRGDVVASSERRPIVANSLSIEAFWLDGLPPAAGERLRLKRGMQDVKIVVDSMPRVYDIEAARDAGVDANVQYNVVRFDARAATEVVFDARQPQPAGSRAVIMRGNHTVGIGFVDRSRSSIKSDLARVTAGDRERRVEHRSAIFWLTGLSGAGKTTLARRAEARLFARGRSVVVLDGDVLRGGLNSDLGFSDDDRREAMRRTAAVANIVAATGAMVIVALISPFADDRALARTAARHPFFDVYVSAALDVCEARDPKRLYRRARGGEITSFTGIDSPYEPPCSPDLLLATDQLSEDAATEQLVEFMEHQTALAR